MRRGTALLDLNVLLALFWPAHEHHSAAHGWFAARTGAPWATCPLTELGFVRIVSNPAFSKDALSPEHAWELLQANLQHPAHEFWPDAIPLSEAIAPAKGRLRAYRQLTDVYLVGLAARRPGGSLASFDRGTEQLVTLDTRAVLEIIPTGATH